MQQRRSIILACLAWTLTVALSGAVSLLDHFADMLEQTRATARTAYEKDITFRRWNASHGGVYVVVD
ncbi:MAG: hypothetical protein Q7U56_13390, partial [Humidesulfovibrio sp.]|nr:hypothetical protein [Humidesulfovibrio sp.]